MDEVRKILAELEYTPSTNEKKNIINMNTDNKLFMKFIKYALDSGKSYGVKTLPEVSDFTPIATPEDIFEELDHMSERNGNKQRLSDLCDDIGCTDLVELILKKDLRCGVGARLINDVVPKHIDIVPYERYKSMKFLSKLDFNSYIIAQLKMNGLFSYYFESKDEFLTRGNKTYKVHGVDYARLSEALNENGPLVFVGEGLIIDSNGNYIDRETSNGIVNSFIHDGSPERHKDFVHSVWMYLTEEEYYNGISKVEYRERFENLVDAFDLVSPEHVRLVEYEPVKSIEEAQVWYKSKRKLKEEGCLIKDADKLCWSDNKSGSKYGVKMKAAAEVEVKIIDAYYGEPGKKWEDYLGGLVVATEDDKIMSKTGMGFSDDLREKGVDWWKEQIGKIVTIKILGIQKGKGKTTYAFESASFVEPRFNEKDTANTYEECVEELSNS